VLGIALRAGFFIGLVAGDPQDDAIYYGNALALSREGPRYLERYRNLPPDFLANPVDQFNVRPLVTYPIAASFVLFGPGELAATLWPLLCSILSMLVVYRLGVVMHDRPTGLIAGLLCAFYPLEVINGTRILSDVQVGLFASVGLLSLVEALRRGDARFYALAGVAAGAAYLANGRGLLVLLALFFVLVVTTGLSGGRRERWRGLLWLVAGFLAVFSVEAAIYALATGDPLLSYHIQAGASRYKYLHEPVASAVWRWLDVRYTNGGPWDLVRSVLLLDDWPAHQFGFFFFFFFAAALYSLVRRRNLLPLTMAAGLFLYLELGPVQIAVDRQHHHVQYMMLFKQPRFLMMVTAPLIVVAADFVRMVALRSRMAAAILALALFVTSLAAIARTRQYYRAGLHDLRSAAGHVRANPNRLFFGDLWAVLDVGIFTRHQTHNLRVLAETTAPDEVRHSCIMLGGSRGVELLADYVASTLPLFARQVLETGSPAPGWQLAMEVEGESSPQRLHNFSVYCVP
jgi:4-amino-4-deoxy-L-arabinose transferase-like glycosyltransferase